MSDHPAASAADLMDRCLRAIERLLAVFDARTLPPPPPLVMRPEPGPSPESPGVT